MRITSPSNPRVKDLVKLRRSHHRKVRDRFIIENARCIDRAMTAGVRIVEVFTCPTLLTDPAAQRVAARLAASDAPSCELTEPVFAKVAYRRRPEGLLAVAERPSHTLDDLPAADNGLYILTESLEKPGNLGAILRSADAVGAAGLILCDRRTDVYNSNAVTASTGTVFTVPIAETTTEEALAWLARRGVTILATVCEGGRPYTDVDLTGSAAVALGTEHEGLSDAVRRAATERITIPMAGVADSLNVAATATVVLFEAARQRRVPDGP
ncbi:MAG: TrmH family RNA methyltransferase [Planctomycetota bacterium]